MFVTNVVKHRPPKNRPPTPEEKETCRPFLEVQLRAVRPRAVLALGKHAAGTLREIAGLPPLGDNVPHQGQHFDLHLNGSTAKVFSVYHPSYACLRNPQMEPVFVADLKRVLAFLDGG